MRPIEDTVVLVTGATDGLGRAVARELFARGARVLVHGRDRTKLYPAARELSRDGVPAPALLADLSSLDEVRDLARYVQRTTPQLHVLINNAGIGSGLPEGRERQVSEDGYELRLAVNHLAGFLLTLRLLPLLRRSAPARIINVASLGQAPIDFDDPMLEQGYSGTRAYGQSKLAQITTGFELAERLDPKEVTVASLHPATYMPTKMVLEEIGSSVDRLEDGVAATVRLALDPELEGVTGHFFDRHRCHRPRAGGRPRGPPPALGAVARAHGRARRCSSRRRGAGKAPRKRVTAGVLPSISRRRSAAPQRAAGRARAPPRACRDRSTTTASGALRAAARGLEPPAGDARPEAVLAQAQLLRSGRARRRRPGRTAS